MIAFSVFDFFSWLTDYIFFVQIQEDMVTIWFFYQLFFNKENKKLTEKIFIRDFLLLQHYV